MRLLHTLNIFEVNLLCYGLAVRRYYGVVILNFLALIHEWSHCSFTTLINEHWSNFEDCLRVEVISRISYRYGSIDFTGYNFKR